MSAIEGQGFRPLELYKAQFPDRVTEPEAFDTETIYTLLLRAVNAPARRGAYANQVRIDEIQKTSVGLYVLEVVILNDQLRETSRVEGDFFDGVWNSHRPFGVRRKDRTLSLRLVDGIISQKELPQGGLHEVDRSLVVPHGRELTGV